MLLNAAVCLLARTLLFKQRNLKTLRNLPHLLRDAHLRDAHRVFRFFLREASSINNMYRRPAV
jgi:hypothetical protein